MRHLLHWVLVTPAHFFGTWGVLGVLLIFGSWLFLGEQMLYFENKICVNYPEATHLSLGFLLGMVAIWPALVFIVGLGIPFSWVYDKVFSRPIPTPQQMRQQRQKAREKKGRPHEVVPGGKEF